MKLIRSYPFVVPPDRAYVIDTIPRWEMNNYDYRSLFIHMVDEVGDSLMLVEWDIAISLENIYAMRDYAKTYPTHVCYAPYRLYRGLASRWVDRSFGFCHIPLEYMERSVKEILGAISDESFVTWHVATYPTRHFMSVPTYPHHLNYDMPKNLL